MNRKWFWLVTFLAFIIVVSSILFFLKTKKGAREEAGPVFTGKAEEKLEANALRKIKLFFFTDSSSLMVPVDRELIIPQIPEETYKKFVEMLLEVPEGYIAPVPPGTSLLDAYFIKEKGVLVLDFSESLRSQFPGGSAAEQEFIYYIVDNVCFNFREVKKVTFLFGGNEQKELSGHLDMERAFYPDFSRLGNE